MIYTELSAVRCLLKTSSCHMDNGFVFKKAKSIKNISPKSSHFLSESAIVTPIEGPEHTGKEGDSSIQEKVQEEGSVRV